MIILNFKNYIESTGENCLKLLGRISDLEPKSQSKIYISPSILDLQIAKQNYPQLNIISQKVDNVPEEQSTGSISPERLLHHGIEFSLYNHSENRVWNDSVLQNIKQIQSRGVNLIVCCENIYEAEILVQANPYAIAYEPKELIGSNTSVTTRPQVVSEFINIVKGKTKGLIGAGIHVGEDIQKGIELGAEGFLISSAYVKSENHDEKIKDFLNNYIK